MFLRKWRRKRALKRFAKWHAEATREVEEAQRIAEQHMRNITAKWHD